MSSSSTVNGAMFSYSIVPSVPVVHHSWLVLPTKSSVRTELMLVNL